jgi:hypothetical protein
MRTRGQTRLCSITYSQIAEWTGLALHTVRSYASRGEFDQGDIESVLTWVNGRRASAGLPMIGQPKEPDSLPGLIREAMKQAEEMADETASIVNAFDAPSITHIPKPTSGGYNPQTGEYTNG